MNKISKDVLVGGFRVGFNYLIAVGGHYKIGKSKNVDGVLADARRFDCSARLINCWPGPSYEDFETLMHQSLASYRMENEQFDLPEKVVSWISALDDYEFAKWASETEFDHRFIGWEFPRHYAKNYRGWRCMFYPRDDVFAEALFVGPKRPDYSDVERLYLQDPRAFSVIGLGFRYPGGVN